MMKAIVFAIVSALAASASAEPGYIDAFVNPDFEDSAFHGSLDKHAEAGRGFGYNGNGGAHVSGFMRHSFVLPVKKGLRLSKGRRYVFSLDVKNNSRNSDVIEQIAFEVYDAKTGKMIFGREDDRDREDYDAQDGMYERICKSFFSDFGNKIH